MSNTLFVPITLDALVADQKVSIAKQGANFSKLPYQDSEFIDLQPDTANLASSIGYKPFNNVGSINPGVHLHWALPDALTQGKAGEGGSSKTLTMPRVPNRWLVIKRSSDDSIEQQWIVESDYLHPIGSTPERAVCIPSIGVQATQLYKAKKETKANDLKDTDAWESISYNAVEANTTYPIHTVVIDQGKLYRATQDSVLTYSNPLGSLKDSAKWQEVPVADRGKTYNPGDMVTSAKGDPPFRYLGRQIPVLSDFSNWEEDLGAERYQDLNVLGWGNPYFSALYGECFSVFGCYDKVSRSTDVSNHSYEVIGWYADSTRDYIKESIVKELTKAGNTRNFSQVTKEIANWDIANDTANTRVYKALKQTLANDLSASEAWQEVSFVAYDEDQTYHQEDIVSHNGKLYQALEEIPQATAPLDSSEGSSAWQEVPLIEKDNFYNESDIIKTNSWQTNRMLCYGRLSFDSSVSSASLDDGINTDDTKLTLASSSTEAVSTYVSKQIGIDQGEALQGDEQLRLENQLEAVMLSDSVQGKNVDFVNRLKSDRHKQSFSQVDGGTLWTFIEESKISIAQQMLVPDAYDSVSKTLSIAGSHFLLTIADTQEFNEGLDIHFNLGAHPVVEIVGGIFKIKLGDTGYATTVGQFKAALEAVDMIEAVETSTPLSDPISNTGVTASYSFENQEENEELTTIRLLTIGGKEFSLSLTSSVEITSHTPEVDFTLLENAQQPLVNTQNDRFTLILGTIDSPTTVGQLRAALEHNPAFERVESTDNQDAELIGNCYDAMEKILYVSGKKFLFSLTSSEVFDSHSLEIHFNLGAHPVVEIVGGIFKIKLGDTGYATTVGQLKVALEAVDMIDAVQTTTPLNDSIPVPDTDVTASYSSTIDGSVITGTLTIGEVVFTLQIRGSAETLLHDSSTPEVNYSLTKSADAPIVDTENNCLSLILGPDNSRTALIELKSALERNSHIISVKAMGNEGQYKNLIQAIATLKDEQSDVLQQLNYDQFQQNQLEFIIQTQRELLYSDWSKYMLCLYPIDRHNDEAYPDSDLIKHYIEQKSLPYLNMLIYEQGQLEKKNYKLLLDLQTTFEDVLGFYKTKPPKDRHSTLVSYNASASTNQRLVKKVPAPRFWEPNEPSLLMSGNVARPSNRHGEDGTLLCMTASLAKWTPNEMLSAANSLPEYWKTRATSAWQRQPWNPIMMEWSVDLYPDHQAIHQNEDQLEPYNPEFIKDSYRIPLNDAEYSLPSASVDLAPRLNHFKTSEQPNTIIGNSLLTGGSRQLVLKKLQGYIDQKMEEKEQTIQTYVQGVEDSNEVVGERYADPIYSIHKALETLTSSQCLTQQLNGLYNAYLMQSSGLRLPIEDPHRFITENAGTGMDTSFTAQVKEALGDGLFKLPKTSNRFLPIRSGILRLNRVRVVDTFGRYKDLACENVLQPQRQLVGSTSYLPPRLVQPARLNLRWHMLPYRELQEMNFKGRTPVCGWLLYNYFDEILVIYNTGGQYMGAINSDGEWQAEDGSNLTDTQNLTNPTLKKFVDKLRSFHPKYRDFEQGTNYLPQLKQAIRRGQENVNPETNNPSQSTLSSQPLAIVRASLDLQLKGIPEANKSWRVLGHDMQAPGIERSNRQFTAVKFPIKLGEYKNLDDGLICYWTQDNQGVLSEIGYFPQSDVQDIDRMLDSADFNPEEHDYVDAIKNEGVANLHHSFEDSPLDLVILMDPEAPIHATTGIVPKKVLRLEPTMYRESLEAIETSYFAAPLLTPTTSNYEHALVLPSGAWQWKQRYYGGHAIPKVSLDRSETTNPKLKLHVGIFEAPTSLKQLKMALEAMDEIDSVCIGSHLADEVMYPSFDYNKLTRELTIADKKFTLVFSSQYQDSLNTHTPFIDLLSFGETEPEVSIQDQTLDISLGHWETPTTVGQLKTALEEKDEIDSVTTTQALDEILVPNSLRARKVLFVSGKKLTLLLSPSHQDKLSEETTLAINYTNQASDPSNISIDTNSLTMDLGAPSNPTDLAALKTALEVTAEIDLVEIDDNPDDQLVLNHYNCETKELWLRGKKFILTLAEEHEEALETHIPTVSALPDGISDPTLAIQDQGFTIALGELTLPTTVGQLKAVLEQVEAIQSVQTWHEASETLITHQLVQEVQLCISGKELILTPVGSALQGSRLVVQYAQLGTLERLTLTQVDKQAFLTNQGTQDQWNTLHDLEILQSDPTRSDRVFYYPPSEDPAKESIADWSFVREALEKSSIPSLIPLSQIGPCEQRVEAIEGSFKKVKFPDKPVQQVSTSVESTL